MTEKEKITENLIKLLSETYTYNRYANNYQDDETGNVIDIVNSGYESPYLYGWNIKKNINDERWSNEWVGYVQNIQDGPFKSFKDMDIKCSGYNEAKEYELPPIPENVQQKFIEIINQYIRKNNGGIKSNNKNSKILLYPSFDYMDRMDPIDISKEKGILFGWFNDEEIMCYSTGYNSIKDLEKAVKDKQYMIEEFIDDEDWEELSGDECWQYIINTIEDSYVDNDSYWSMFLIDANNNYKILYCGSEEPEIRI